MAGIYTKIKKAGTQTRFSTITEEIESLILPAVDKFIMQAEKHIYQQFSNRYLDQKTIDVIKKELSWAMSHSVDAVINNTQELAGTLFAAHGIKNSKTISNLVNYVSNGFGGDMADLLLSVKGQTERALNHISYTFGIQNNKEARMLYNEIKNLSGEDLKKGLESFQRVFSDEYGKRFLNEMTKNPVLASLIKQENGQLFFYNKNGRRYDIAKYKKAWGDYLALDAMRKAQGALARDNGLEVFRFERVRSVIEPREHSSREGEYFTTNPALVGKSINGKVINADLISDFHINDEPPHGCGHLYIAVEYSEEELEGNIKEDAKKDYSFNNDDTGKLNINKTDSLNKVYKLLSDKELLFNGELKVYDFNDKNISGETVIYDNKKDIIISSTISKNLENMFKKIKENDGDIKETEIFALSTYFHELVHTQQTYYPLMSHLKDKYKIKEYFTEIIARYKCKKYLLNKISKNNIDIVGNYDNLILLYGFEINQDVINQIESYLKDSDFTNIVDFYNKLKRSSNNK